ncbi:hypothetical protein [Limibacterium fermenti]|uniref:hypothetical protein n=1 Tax=Limibacterium fermenti TaxID=3229863 RepID=UPI003A709F87
MRTYFSNFPWKNLFTFLFFVLLSFIFWLMFFFQRDIDGTYRIPLKYTHIADNEIFDSPLPEFLEIRVSGKGSEMFRLDLSKRDSLEVNVEEYKQDGIVTLQGNQYIQLIGSRLPGNVQLRGYSPANISLVTSKLQNKKLSVVFDGEITTSRANLVADTATFVPPTVTAYGAQRDLDELTAAITEYTVFDRIKATSQLSIKIKPVTGVKFVPDAVEIYIPVKEYTERTIEIPITCRNLPQDRDVKFFPSRASISFSVTLDEYKNITPEDFQIQLDYRQFHSNENGRVELELTKSPSSIVNTRISPSSVEFLFEDR